MSLLMDALKRAEREREAQASKQGTGEAEAPAELSLDPMDEPETKEADTGDEPWTLLDEAGEVSHGFEVEADDAAEMALEPSATPEPEEPEPLSRSPEGLDDIPFITATDEPLPMEDTSSTLPSMKAVKASVDRYFDGSHSASLSMSMPIETDEATTVVQQREAAEAQAAAKTVFDAKLPRRRSGAGTWAGISILMLVVLAGGGYAWSIYTGQDPQEWAQETIALLRGESSSIRPRSAPGAVGASSQAVATSGSAAVAGVEAPQQQGTALGSVEPALGDVLHDEPPASGDLTPPEPEVVEVPPEEVLPPPEPKLSPEELLASAGEQIAAVLGEQRLMAPGAIRKQGISISSRKVSSKVDPLLMDAYQAFMHGQLDSAEKAYRAVLVKDATNRDALLGLGAIAIRQARPAAAVDVYTQLLQRNPRDSVAQASLIALQSSEDPADSESRIKIMLEREPSADFLHFSLGNLYARQSRWANAQSAYFKAYSLDSANADYAYNLAVGLDHVGQPQAALKFYRAALDLARQNPRAFELAAVERRIESITGATSAP